jgi:uncharacterized Zn-finger protein
MAGDREAPVYSVRAEDLPVFCPNPDMLLWASHPRIYLDIDESGVARCPYCSTVYKLEGGARPPAQH